MAKYKADIDLWMKIAKYSIPTGALVCGLKPDINPHLHIDARLPENVSMWPTGYGKGDEKMATNEIKFAAFGGDEVDFKQEPAPFPTAEDTDYEWAKLLKKIAIMISPTHTAKDIPAEKDEKIRTTEHAINIICPNCGNHWFVYMATNQAITHCKNCEQKIIVTTNITVKAAVDKEKVVEDTHNKKEKWKFERKTDGPKVRCDNGWDD